MGLRVCPRCGRPVLETAARCGACGHALQAGAQKFVTGPLAWAMLAGGPVLIVVGVAGLVVGGWATAAGSCFSVLAGAALILAGVRVRRR